MQKKTIFQIAQASIIVLFAWIAISCGCSSPQDAVDFMDGFTEGYRDARGYSEVHEVNPDDQNQDKDMAYEDTRSQKLQGEQISASPEE